MQLREQGSLAQNVTLDSRVNTHTFTSVTPGTLCRVAVVAKSKGKESDLVSEEVLTGKKSQAFSVQRMFLYSKISVPVKRP